MPRTKKEDKRHPKLAEWITNQEHLSLAWQATDKLLPCLVVTCYIDRRTGKLFIIREYTDEGGFDVYIPACEENDTAKTLAAVDTYLTTPAKH